MGAHVSVPMYRRTLPQRLRFEGRRCSGCGQIFFPPLGACRACGGALEPFGLRGLGRLHASTYITGSGAPPEFTGLTRLTGGYHVGIVELDEGPMITAQLTDLAEAPQPGMRLVAVARRLYDEEGVIRYGFKFRPVQGAEPELNGHD